MPFLLLLRNLNTLPNIFITSDYVVIPTMLITSENLAYSKFILPENLVYNVSALSEC